MDWNRKHTILLIAFAVLLLAGCSAERSPLSPPSSSGNAAPAGEVYQYPPLTDELLSHVPAGFAPLATASTELDGWCDTMRVSRWCHDETPSTTVSLGWLVSIRLTRGDLHSDTLISIVAPRSCIAAADFYPHPYSFDGTVEITWNIASLNLPRNYDYSQIVPWYVTEQGEFVPLQYTWVNGHDFLVVYTNHFSRYILGGPAN
jgi:hypothetical protein